MSLFWLCRNRFLAVICLVFTFSQLCIAIPGAAYADTSWAELLKPLVKDVIVPGASAGMKKFIEKKMKVKLDKPSEGAASPWPESVMTMPEEPSSTAGEDAGGLISMPEEPTYSASWDNQANEADVLSSPPPPVETP
jgi:hypothetical protein